MKAFRFGEDRSASAFVRLTPDDGVTCIRGCSACSFADPLAIGIAVCLTALVFDAGCGTRLRLCDAAQSRGQRKQIAADVTGEDHLVELTHVPADPSLRCDADGKIVIRGKERADRRIGEGIGRKVASMNAAVDLRRL